ncbi:ankyrin [Xylaria acuta]|nr:ankyrin [Xylaria acuta]
MPAIPTLIAGTAQRKPDFSLFEQHRSKFRELYLEQDKSLVKVKEEMETYYGFPETDSKIYEYGLRHLGFIKKLPIEGWIAVDVCAKKRKEREGKETDVYLSGIQHPWDKIRRRISRHHNREPVRKRVCRRPTPDLPEGVDLKTPLPSPNTMVNTPQRSLIQTSDPSLRVPINRRPDVGLQYQRSSDVIWTLLLSNPNSTVHGLPEAQSSQPMNMFRQIINSALLSFRDRESYEIHPFSFPWNSAPAHNITPPPQRHQVLSSLRLPTSSVTQAQLYFLEGLSKLCIILANDYRLEITDTRDMLAWVGMDANKLIMKLFFGVDSPAVAAMWARLVDLSRDFKSGNAFQALVEVGFETHNGELIQRNASVLIRATVQLGSKEVGEIARRLLSSKLVRHVLDSNLDGQLRDIIERRDVKMMSLFAHAGVKLKHVRSELLSGYYRDEFYETAQTPQTLVKLLEKAGCNLDCSVGPRRGLGDFSREFDSCCYREMGERYLDRYRLNDLSPDNPHPDIHCVHEVFIHLDELWLSGNYELYKAAAASSKKAMVQITISGLIRAARSGTGELQVYLDSKRIGGNASKEMLLETALSEASGLGDVAAIQSFRDVGVKPNAPMLMSKIRVSKSNWQPLMRAAGAKHLDAVRALVEMGADMILDIDGCNPLSAAIWKPKPLSYTKRLEQMAIVEYFIGKGLAHVYGVDAVIGAVAPPYRREIEPAARLDDFVPDEEIIDLLLAAGIELNGITVAGKDILHHAIDRGCNLRTVEILLSLGAQIHSRPCPEERKTMLHSAAASRSKDSLQIVELLLRNGASCTEEYGERTILESALPHQLYAQEESERTRRVQLVSLLLDSGAYVNNPVESEAMTLILMRLLVYDAPDALIYRAIQAGADVNPPASKYGIHYTPLQLAAQRCRLDVTRRLVDVGADINAPAASWNGQTALQAACDPDGSEINMCLIRFLINKGADINAPAAFNGGATALQFACTPHTGREIHMGLIEFLIDKGADINAPAASKHGGTALQRACGIYDFDEINMGLIQFLIDKGAEINAPAASEGGTTALQSAIRAGSMSVFCLLLDKGANIHETVKFSYECESALDTAAALGRLDMVDMLLRRGAESYKQRRTPYEGAIENATTCGYFPIAKMLEQFAKRNR